MNKIIYETCDAIFQCLKDEHVLAPSTQEEWLSISKQFQEMWDEPHVIGTIDGKHI